MSEQPPTLDPDDTTRVKAARGSTARRPRWVLVAGIVVVVLALIVVIMLLTGGNHSPGRHMGSTPVVVQQR